MDPLTFLEKYWRPALEILLLAAGIYYVGRFVRGTRAAAILTGLIILVLSLTIISVVLDFTVIRWLLAAFLQVFAFVVVVIFQPELRRFFAELGNLQPFNPAHKQRENIEVVIQTVERLAEVRIGALIAIEQKLSVLDSTESGIPVDCVATPEMLETIFFPNNAIHDGGVILKGDRITHAACIFPLTQRQDLSRSLGTRHRAAIGLSEETDAIVVTVSEETGAISHSYKGLLTRGVSAEELRAFLTGILVPAARSRSLADWFRQRPAEAPRPTAPPVKAELP